MTVESKKMLAVTPAAEKSAPEKLSGETATDTAKCITEKSCIAGEIPIYNIRWYPSSKSCVRISDHRPKPQQTPPLMVRKAEWRR